MNNQTHILNQQHKQIYNRMIDEVLSTHGFANECMLYYQNSSTEYCDNCNYDPISKISSNIYNGVGPQPFVDHTICPECMGAGIKRNNNKTKSVVLAVIFDSKYFLNLDTKVMNIPNVNLQTICSQKYAHDLLNASAMSINSIPNTFYERIGDLNPVGLGDLNYIFINWKKQ